jgi:CRP/FNR family transcriptional regulator, anaerobic regulatory protein
MQQYFLNAGLDNAQIEKLTSIFTKKLYLKSGEYFVKEGQVSNYLGIIVKGASRYYHSTFSGDEITRWVALENELTTSLSSFITGLPSTENIQAIKPTEILLARKADWDILYAENEFVRNIWTKRIEEEYLGMEKRLTMFITRNAYERYQWMLGFRPRFLIEVPHKYVADMLGITPRHLSRLRNLKNRHLSA